MLKKISLPKSRMKSQDFQFLVLSLGVIRPKKGAPEVAMNATTAFQNNKRTVPKKRNQRSSVFVHILVVQFAGDGLSMLKIESYLETCLWIVHCNMRLILCATTASEMHSVTKGNLIWSTICWIAPSQRNSALMRRQEANHAGYSNSPLILKTNAFTGHVHEEQRKPSATAFYCSKLTLTVRATWLLKQKVYLW